MRIDADCKSFFGKLNFCHMGTSVSKELLAPIAGASHEKALKPYCTSRDTLQPIKNKYYKCRL